MASKHVLVIGAGICGLAIAHGLQKAGIPFTIFEAEEISTFRPREWTMALHWSVPMLKELLPDDLAARLEVDAVVDPSLDYTTYPNNVIPVIDGANGELIREIPSDGLRVSRRKLRALCSEQMEVQFGHKLEDIEFKDGLVIATFANGKEYSGSILVGADGSRSRVREKMFPDNASTTALDLVYTNVTFSYPDAERALFVRNVHPVAALVVHPDSSALVCIQDAKEPQKPETWVFQLIIMWKGARKPGETSEEIHTQVKERAEKLPEPFRSAFLWTPEDIELRHYELGYWDPPKQPWPTHGGLVTLAGDSGHSMPPHRGQGLNNAINDAYNFVAAVKSMAHNNQSQIIQDYSQEVAERGGKEVELSRSTAGLMLEYTRFRESALITQGLKKG